MASGNRGVVRKFSEIDSAPERKNASVYQPTPLLPTMYALNKSYTKKIMVCMENAHNGAEDFEPVVRIMGADGNGIKLTSKGWCDFKETFPKMKNYFASRDAQEENIHYDDFTVRLCTGWGEKMFELVEKVSVEGKNGKAFQKSLAFKRPTIEYLTNVAKCVDVRYEWLSKVKDSVKHIIDAICEYIIDKMSLENESQVLYISAHDVVRCTETFPDTLADDIKKALLDKKDIVMTCGEVEILMYEIARLHIYILTCVISDKLMFLQQK